MSAAEGKPDAAAAEEMAPVAAAWCAMHGLVVGDRAVPVRPVAPPSLVGSSNFLGINLTKHCCCPVALQRSGTAPGVGLVHAPISLLPSRLPESFWEQACELAPIFNDLVDRVSLDGDFLQDSLSK